MTIYVDECVNKKANRLWCHMMTDQNDLEELHAIAAKIGLKREWFQEHRAHPHYDLTTSKRSLAIRHGAKAVDGMELVRRCSRMIQSIGA